MNDGLKKPPALPLRGDVWAVAPSGPPDAQKYTAGVDWLERAGYRVHQRPDVLTRGRRYLDGTADERFAELAAAYAAPGGAIFAARGGYGAMHLLPRLDAIIRGAPPKLVIGFSDITALGAQLLCHGIPWLHGPLLTTLAAEPQASTRHLAAIWSGQGTGLSLSGAATIAPGRVRGRLAGGSLSLLSALCGTAHLPDLRGAIVFFEDVGERPYRIDRMITQLDLAGALTGVAGFVLGYFTDCLAPDRSYTGLEIAEEMLARRGVPVLSGVQAGHASPNYALPMGVEIELDAGAKKLTILEEIVTPAGSDAGGARAV